MFARMVACRTNGRWFGTFVNITAYKAHPAYGFFAFPDRAVLDLFFISVESAFVTELDFRNRTEMFGNVCKTFFVGYFGGFLILFDTFDMFAFSSLSKI